ncbi:Membrane anchored protein Mac1 [Schizosaccharomyces pombe]
MIRNTLAFLAILFLLIPTALLIIGSVSVPSTRMTLAKVEGTEFGIFGTCTGNGTDCTETSFGYNASSSLIDDFYYKGDKRLVLSKVLITHIISAFLSFLSAIFVFFSIFLVNQAVNIINIIVVFITTLLTCLAFAIELVLFLPHNTWQSYVTAGAIGSDLIAILALCLRSVSISRIGQKSARLEHVDTMNSSYSSYKTDVKYPLALDDKLSSVPTLPKFHDALTSTSEFGPPSDSGDTVGTTQYPGDIKYATGYESTVASPVPSRVAKLSSRDTPSIIADYDEFRKSESSPSRSSVLSTSKPEVHETEGYSPHKTGNRPGFPSLNIPRTRPTTAGIANTQFDLEPYRNRQAGSISSEGTDSRFFDVENQVSVAQTPSVKPEMFPKTARPFAAIHANASSTQLRNTENITHPGIPNHFAKTTSSVFDEPPATQMPQTRSPVNDHSSFPSDLPIKGEMSTNMTGAPRVGSRNNSSNDLHAQAGMLKNVGNGPRNAPRNNSSNNLHAQGGMPMNMRGPRGAPRNNSSGDLHIQSGMPMNGRNGPRNTSRNNSSSDLYAQSGMHPNMNNGHRGAPRNNSSNDLHAHGGMPVNMRGPRNTSRNNSSSEFNAQIPMNLRNGPRNASRSNSSTDLFGQSGIPGNSRGMPTSPNSRNNSALDLSMHGIPQANNSRQFKRPSYGNMSRPSFELNGSRNPSHGSLNTAHAGMGYGPRSMMRDPQNLSNVPPVSNTLDQLSGNADFELPVRGNRNNRRGPGGNRMIR